MGPDGAPTTPTPIMPDNGIHTKGAVVFGWSWLEQRSRIFFANIQKNKGPAINIFIKLVLFLDLEISLLVSKYHLDKILQEY